MPAKMLPVLCCPRPESEIQSAITVGETLIARQQFFYADGVFEFRLKISIQGGAYPFYEDTSTRSGWPSWLNLDSNVYTSGTTKNPDYLVFRGVPPVRVKRIYTTGTTASSIVGLF